MAPKTGVSSLSPLQKGLAKLIDLKGSDISPVTVDTSALVRSKPVINSGSIEINYAIGGDSSGGAPPPCPGYPKSNVIQIWGEESAGKTTLVLHACAGVNAAGGEVVYIDWEHVLDLKYAENLGVEVKDPTKFMLFQPITLEEGITIAAEMIKSGVAVVVFDSVGAGTPEKTFNNFLDDASETDNQTMLLAKIWSQKLPMLTSLAQQSGTTIFAISQQRETVPIGFKKGFAPPPPKPQGGNAWKFYSSLRISLKRGLVVKSKVYDPLLADKVEKVIGSKVRMTIQKNKWAPTAQNCVDFYIIYGRGIDNVRSLIDIALAHDIIQKKGKMFYWVHEGQELKFNGQGKLTQYFAQTGSKENKERAIKSQQDLWNQIKEKFKMHRISEDELEDEDYTLGEEELED
jgi:recombination protein RecA